MWKIQKKFQNLIDINHEKIKLIKLKINFDRFKGILKSLTRRNRCKLRKI